MWSSENNQSAVRRQRRSPQGTYFFSPNGARANPPFTGSVFQEEISKDLLALCKTRKTELLFVALFTKMLKVGGRCACIVPDGVLFGSSKARQAIRREFVERMSGSMT